MNSSNQDDRIVIVGAKRSAFGDFGGSLKDLSATDLAVQVSEQVFKSSPVPAGQIDHVTFGNVIQSSSDAAYLARHVGLRSGVPLTAPALTLNRLCGSGFEAIADGARRLKLLEANCVLVGGSENMSQAPFVLRKSRFGYRMGNGELEDSLVAGLYDTYAELPMALTAERLAEKYHISREEVDEFALESQQKATRARESGLFQNEICPIETKSTSFIEDEHVRPSVSLSGLQKLKPVFKKDGVVTAGNASGICDGAAALILTRESFAQQNSWPVLAVIEAYSQTGCDPKEMGLGPVSASRALLKASGYKKEDIRLFEINEAFAAQVLAVQKELEFPKSRLNQCGGAIAIGHPLAASGARLVVHLVHQLRSNGGGLGLATACIGGGQGMAVLLKVE